MSLSPRTKALKDYALSVANRLNNSRQTHGVELSADARSRRVLANDPAQLYSEYPPVPGVESCPECWISARGHQVLILASEVDTTDIMKCPKCRFMPQLLKDQEEVC